MVEEVKMSIQDNYNDFKLRFGGLDVFAVETVNAFKDIIRDVTSIPSRLDDVEYRLGKIESKKKKAKA